MRNALLPLLLCCFSSVIFCQNELREHIVFSKDDSTLDVIDIERGDLDGDGDLDVLSLSEGDGKVAYYLNEGEGFSDQIQLHLVGSRPTDVAMADIDMDGDQDILIIANDLVYYENKNGEFEIGELNFEEDSDPINVDRLEIVDMDNDGYLDIVVGEDYKLVYLNKGVANVVFESPIFIDGFRLTQQMSDINADGYLDFVGLDLDAIVIYYFNGSAFEEERIELGQNTYFAKVAVGDYDSDGDIDIAAMSYQVPVSNTLFIALTQNDNNFEVATREIEDVLPEQLHILDYDNDGEQEIIFNSDHDLKLYSSTIDDLLLSNMSVISNVDYVLEDMVFDDFDQDGELELITASSGTSRIRYFDYDNGEYVKKSILGSKHVEATAVVVDDWDNNGEDEILVSYSYSRDIVRFVPEGNAYTEEVVVDRDLGKIVVMKSFDVDNDGDNELISSGWWDDPLNLIEPNPDNNEWNVTELIDTNATFALAVENVWPDDPIEILATDNTKDTLFVFQYDAVSKEIISRSRISDYIKLIAESLFVDLDGDGDKDIVGLSYHGQVFTIENMDNLSFGETRFVEDLEPSTYSVKCADLDLDGNKDIIILGAESNTVFVLKGDSNGEFTRSDHPLGLNEVNAMQLLDINADGYDDLVVGIWYGGLYYLVYDELNNTFDEAVAIESSLQSIRVLETHDMDLDGDLDIVACADKNNAVAWFENNIISRVSDSDKDILVHISPNPTSNYAFINSTIDFEQISLYDSQGRFIRNVNENKVEVSDLVSGVYYVHFKAGTQVEIKTLVVLK